MIVSVGLLRLHLKSYGAKPPQYQVPSLQLFASCDASMCGMFYGTYRTMALHANCRSGREETCAAWRPFGGLRALEIPGRHCCGRSRMSAHWSRKRTSSSRASLVLWTNPLQELPRRHRRDATDRAAEIAGDVPAERPLPEQSHQVARRQHHRERDQQSLPSGMARTGRAGCHTRACVLFSQHGQGLIWALSKPAWGDSGDLVWQRREKPYAGS